jgi:hypothetical protein
MGDGQRDVVGARNEQPEAAHTLAKARRQGPGPQQPEQKSNNLQSNIAPNKKIYIFILPDISMFTYRYILNFISMFFVCELHAQVSVSDTVFIKKDKVHGAAQSIFIDNSKNTMLINEIIKFDESLFSELACVQSKLFLKKNNLMLEKQPTILPYKNWIEIKNYRQQWYAYYPCDFYFSFKQSITDSCFIDWGGEGPVINKIIHQKLIDSNKYELQLTGVHSRNRTITIKIIDAEKGIAVFRETDSRAKTQCYVMIAAEKLQTLPLIVNKCVLKKQDELEFAETDCQIFF